MRVAEKLEEITDNALFEKLANSVLRFKFPELTNLIETGINAKGESRKSPLDAFCKVTEDYWVLIEHTIDDTNLVRKWLNEKVTKASKEGDLIKAIREAKKIREKLANTTFKIYLVTNHYVSTELFLKVSQSVQEDFIQVQIIEQSIISSYLENTPEGQFLAKKYLNIDIVLLSISLFKELMKININQYKAECFIEDSLLVETEETDKILTATNFEHSNLTLLVGNSGFGKSTSCYLLLNKYLGNDTNALRVKPAIIKQSQSISESVELQLKSEYLNLFIQQGKINELFKEGFLIIIDDINKDENPKLILDKLISWGSVKNQYSNQVVILCPVWPKYLSQIENKPQKELLYNTYTVSKPNHHDAVQFVEKGLSDIVITKSDVNSILKDTSYDPLLINLYIHLIKKKGHYLPSQGLQVVSSFVDDNLNEIAEIHSSPAIKIKKCFEELGAEMLERKVLNPTYTEITEWFKDNTITISILDTASNKRKVFYYGEDGRIVFRHDRIRDYFLTLGLNSKISSIQYYENIFNEPYYSEIIGSVISEKNLTDTEIETLLLINPLAVFYSLKYLQSNEKNDLFSRVVGFLILWNKKNVGNSDVPFYINRDIIWALLNIDTKEIDLVTDNMPETVELSLAKFRNGDCIAGIRYFMAFREFTPTYRNYWREVVIDHVIKKHLSKMEDALMKYLPNGLIKEARPYACLLAGYLKSSMLVNKIDEYWQISQNREDYIFYLWAILNCFDKSQEHILINALKYWNELEVEVEEHNAFPKSLRNQVILEMGRVPWKFNEVQIDILTNLSQDKSLNSIIFSVLKYVDSPQALLVTITEMEKKIEDGESKGFYFSKMDRREDRWDYDKTNYRLSKDSITFLKHFWENKANSNKARSIALRLLS